MPNNFTSHFSADDAALLLIDFQPQMLMGVESHDRNAIKNNLQIIAKSAKLPHGPGRRRANHRTAFRLRAAAGLGPSGNASRRDGHHEDAHSVRHSDLLLQVGAGRARQRAEGGPAHCRIEMAVRRDRNI